MTPANAECIDCHTDTTPCTHRRGCRHVRRGERYMVAETVWAAAGSPAGHLCVGCLEFRLGRRLQPADFPPGLRVNEPHPWHTARLVSRLVGAEEQGGDGLRDDRDEGPLASMVRQDVRT